MHKPHTAIIVQRVVCAPEWGCRARRERRQATACALAEAAGVKEALATAGLHHDGHRETVLQWTAQVHDRRAVRRSSRATDVQPLAMRHRECRSDLPFWRFVGPPEMHLYLFAFRRELYLCTPRSPCSLLRPLTTDTRSQLKRTEGGFIQARSRGRAVSVSLASRLAGLDRSLALARGPGHTSTVS